MGEGAGANVVTRAACEEKQVSGSIVGAGAGRGGEGEAATHRPCEQSRGNLKGEYIYIYLFGGYTHRGSTTAESDTPTL